MTMLLGLVLIAAGVFALVAQVRGTLPAMLHELAR
jgi:hypothetical protein